MCRTSHYDTVSTWSMMLRKKIFETLVHQILSVETGSEEGIGDDRLGEKRSVSYSPRHNPIELAIIGQEAWRSSCQ